METKKIAIIGVGYVGITTALIFSEIDYNVICIDTNKDKINKLKNKIMPIHEEKCQELLIKNYSKLSFESNFKNIKDIDIFFVCVGTPLNEEGSLETSGLIDVCKSIKENSNSNNDIIICIRSTILPNTCKMLDKIIDDSRFIITHNPEFLAQGTAINDSINPSRIVIGSDNEKASIKIQNIYKNLLKKFKCNTPILIMNRIDAEMIKFVANSYLAMRISYINEISNLCEKLGVNIDNVIDGVKYDKRIGGSYFKYGIGYGGSCLPKDTQSIFNLSLKENSKLNLIGATIEANNFQLKMCVQKVINDFKDISKEKIAILGLTFKANTDDIRNSSSIYITNMLLKHKAKINVYDPKGINNFKKIFKNKVNYFDNIDDCVDSCNIIIVLTEWKNIINYNYEKLNKNKKLKIYDFKACLKKQKISKKLINYWVVGGNNE